MGNQLFGVDIAGIIAEALGDGLFPVTITREVPGVADPDNLTGGRVPAAPVSFDCIGVWEDFTGTPPPNVTLELNDRKLVLIGDSIPVDGIPRAGDACVVHENIGDVGPLYAVKLLSRDPAAAVYQFLCRDRRGPVTA